MERLAWHFDFHSHKDIRINHDPDVEGMAKTMAECGIEEIITFAKGHDGFAYYPGKVGYIHPRMKGDAFGDVVKACKKKGIRVLAYISFGVDGEAGRLHPDWVTHDVNGPVGDGFFMSVCPFTPYLTESVLPMIAEIAAGYPVDGFFFDTMGALGICYCDACRKDFQERHGKEIPRDEKSPDWGVYGEFRRRRAGEMLGLVGRFIRERKPDAKVGFNHVGTARYPEPLPEGVSCITLDFSTSGTQSLSASLNAAYGSTTGYPSDVMNTIFNHGWGDWSPRPTASLEQVAAAVWARRCRPYVGDRLRPENRLDAMSVRAMRHLAHVETRMRKEFPPPDAPAARDVLLLIGPKMVYGEDMRNFAAGFWNPFASLQGAHRLLLDCGSSFGIVSEVFLEKNLPGCRLVILPEMPAIGRETEQLLLTYVEKGGTILICGGLPRVDGKSVSWPGVSRSEKPWQDHYYLPAWEAGGDPVLARGEYHILETTGAEGVLPVIKPYDCSFGMRFGWGIGPASKEPETHFAVTRKKIGAGNVWYFEGPFLSSYLNYATWTHIEWFRALLDRIIPSPVAQAVSPCGTVECVAYRNAKTTWVVLVNHGGEQVNVSHPWARMFEPVPPFETVLRLGADRREPSAVTVGGTPAAWKKAGQNITVPVRMDAIWKIVRVDWK